MCWVTPTQSAISPRCSNVRVGRQSASDSGRAIEMPKRNQRRLPGEGRTFGSMRILDDGRVRYSAWTAPGLERLVVHAHYHGFDLNDEYVGNTSTYGAFLYWGERPIFLISVRKHRVEATQFTYNL